MIQTKGEWDDLNIAILYMKYIVLLILLFSFILFTSSTYKEEFTTPFRENLRQNIRYSRGYKDNIADFINSYKTPLNRYFNL